MRCAAIRSDKTAFSLAASLAVFGACLSVGMVTGAPAHAQTTVTASVCGAAAPASISITKPFSGQAFSSLPIRLEGTLVQLSQVRVFIDGEYRQTIPLDSGATSFAHDQVIESGSHVIRLEGVDSCQRTNPVAEVNVTYDAATVVAGAQESPQSSTPPSFAPAPEMSAVPLPLVEFIRPLESVLQQGLVVLDFARIESTSEVPAMVGRFAALSTGLAFVIFTQPVLTLFGAAAGRFGVLQAIHLPALVSRHPVASLRLLGTTIIVGLIAFAVL